MRGNVSFTEQTAPRGGQSRPTFSRNCYLHFETNYGVKCLDCGRKGTVLNRSTDARARPAAIMHIRIGFPCRIAASTQITIRELEPSPMTTIIAKEAANDGSAGRAFGPFPRVPHRFRVASPDRNRRLLPAVPSRQLTTSLLSRHLCLFCVYKPAAAFEIFSTCGRRYSTSSPRTVTANCSNTH